MIFFDPCLCKPSYVSMAFFVYKNRSKDTMGRIQIIFSSIILIQNHFLPISKSQFQKKLRKWTTELSKILFSKQKSLGVDY